MKTVNLQVRINEDLKQEVSSILKAQGGKNGEGQRFQRLSR